MQTWLRRLLRVVRPSQPASPVSRYRPTLEALEERSLLATAFLQTNLIADTAGVAAHTDANVVNPWGISFAPSGPFWLADNGTGVSTLNDGSGADIGFFVTIPPQSGGTSPSHPTGTVYNGNTSEFLVSGPGSPAASFLFATEEGTISGWSGGGNAIREVDNSGSGAVYKGLAIARQGNNDFLYATDFHNGRVDVFDSTFANVTTAGSFTDPNLPSGFAPFGIQNLGGNLFVTYAQQDAAKHDDVAGPGNGFVDVFSPSGVFIKRLVSQGPLNSPWGLALAPAGFGPFGGDLLVGNFGNGTINTFDPASGTSLGPLQNANGQTIQIDGLWGLAFGNGAGAGATNTLYFTAGPGDEAHGLFGSLEAKTTTPPPGPGPTPMPMPTPTPVLLDVSALVSVKKVLPRNHHSNPRQQKVMFHNNSGTSITGPVFLVVSGLPAKVKLRNAAGFTTAHGKPGDPFLRFDLSAFAPDQTVSFTLLFGNPKNKAVHFTTLVLAGTGTV
jgi:uncharacterized protein (TIGR03118 family)